MPGRIRANIQKIREYTQQHKELREAHHFLYGLPLNESYSHIDFVVMGVNPDETPRDWKIESTPTEVTSEHDFRAKHGSGSSRRRWQRNVNYFLGTTNVVLTECFFWSSRNVKEFHKRYGTLGKSPHLQFCTSLNKQLIAAHLRRQLSSRALVIRNGSRNFMAWSTSAASRKINTSSSSIMLTASAHGSLLSTGVAHLALPLASASRSEIISLRSGAKGTKLAVETTFNSAFT